MFVVLDAVAALDLGEFRRRHRADGHGRASSDPEMMVAGCIECSFAPQGDGWLVAASPAPKRSLGLLHTVFVRRFRVRPARSGELCRRRRFPGCAGASPANPRAASLEHQLGCLVGRGFADSVGGKRLAARLALLGIDSIAPMQGLEVLGRLLGQSAAEVLVVPVNWKQYREFHPADSASPLLSELVREEAEAPMQRTARAQGGMPFLGQGPRNAESCCTPT